MLAGIVEYRQRMERVVRRGRADVGSGEDVDVSLFDYEPGEPMFVDRDEHRRNACEARAELWRAIRRGEVSNGDDADAEPTEAVQCFEEWSHTS